MDNHRRLLDGLAELLVYPGVDYLGKCDYCADQFTADALESSEQYSAFHDAIRDKSVTELEELFTGTFDLNPVCSLEVGWHLFGENYSRGDFLVFMRQQLRKFGLPESGELPDHLRHVLQVAARMDPGQADELADKYLSPALDKMLTALTGKNNPYESLLKEIRNQLKPAERAEESDAPRIPLPLAAEAPYE